MHQLSEQLAIATLPGTWDPSRGWTSEQIQEIKYRIEEEVFSTPAGKELLIRGGDDIVRRFIRTFNDRYEGKSPSLNPYLEYMAEVVNDMLAILPAAIAPKSAPAPNAKLAPAVAKQEASAELRKFAHMFNSHVLEVGVPKLNGGYYTLEANGVKYKYLFSDFTSLMEEAIKFGLIR